MHRAPGAIEMRDIRYFLAAAAHGSFRKAGKALAAQESSCRCGRRRGPYPPTFLIAETPQGPFQPGATVRSPMKAACDDALVI